MSTNNKANKFMAKNFVSTNPVTCPASLLEKAKQGGIARVVVARASSALPMQSIKLAVDAGIAIPVFAGEPELIQAEADKMNWDISAYEIISAVGEAESAKAAAIAARDGKADVVMKGQLHTDVFMKAMLSKDEGIRDGKRFIHVFHMSLPDVDKPLLISDGAVNVSPDMKTRQTAVQEVAAMLNKLGNPNPKIGILSATEEPIASVPSSIEARELADWAQENVNNAVISGPLALDLMLSPESTSIKGKSNDPVAGQADAVIVPDIVSGNVLFKALVYLRGACAAGVVVGGKVPIILTSRADPPEARLASIALAAAIA